MMNDQIVCNVYQTTDYSKFKYLKGNRKINLHNLRRLRESLSERQLVSTVIVNDKFEIIDGQHRYEACKELDLPVYYIIAKGYGLHEVQVLNTNSANWTKKEYLNAYCDLGAEDYLKMREFMTRFADFGLTTCISLLTGRTNTASQMRVEVKGEEFKTSDKSFESGKFKITDWDFAVKSAEKILMVKPYYEGFNRRSFVLAMMSMFKNDLYNHADFLNKLSYQSVALQDCVGQLQYKILIEEIYNYRRRKKVNLRYAA